MTIAEETLNTLAEAIANVGYWTWWTAEDQLQSIQLEFDGVQLYLPSGNQEPVPSNQIALRCEEPSHIQFFQSPQMTDDWPERLANDELDPFLLDSLQFILSTRLDLPTFLEDAQLTRELHPNDIKPRYQLAFYTGEVGLRIVTHDLRLFCHQGKIEFSDVESLHQRWRQYRGQYLASQATDQPMHHDETCEASRD